MNERLIQNIFVFVFHICDIVILLRLLFVFTKGSCIYWNHSHKKQKDSLEARAKLAVLQTYVENQAILEPILPHRAQNVNKPKSRAVRTHIVYGLILLPFCVIIVSFFSFFYQDANEKGSNCTIIGCNLSKKHKLALYKTQSGELNYVDLKFFKIFC